MTAGQRTHAPPAAFRGARNYVHSTDIYEEAAAGAEAAGLDFAGPIDLRLGTRMAHAPVYRYGMDSASPKATNTCRFTSGGQPWCCEIEESDRPVVERKPYDEGPIAAHGSFHERTARLNGHTGLRPIEALTGLAVALHKAAAPIPESERWMLARVTLRRALEAADSERLEVTIERTLAGSTTRSSITAHDGPLGTLFFMRSGVAS